MFISVKHNISNPPEFWGIAQKTLPNLRKGIKLHSSYPIADMSTAFCLCEADLLDGFKKYLEAQVGHVSKNDYYVIEEQFAIGLPK